jgi:hypothetical protein
MDSVHDVAGAAGAPRSAAPGLEIVASVHPGRLAVDLTAEFDCTRPPGVMPPRVERHLARTRILAVFQGSPSLLELTDHPEAERQAWAFTWEWPGDPTDEQERRRAAFRVALRANGWSDDAIENAWLHPYRHDMLEYLRLRDPKRCRNWEATMQRAAEQATTADPGRADPGSPPGMDRGAVRFVTRPKDLARWRWTWQKVKHMVGRASYPAIIKWLKNTYPDATVSRDTLGKIVRAGQLGLLDD